MGLCNVIIRVTLDAYWYIPRKRFEKEWRREKRNAEETERFSDGFNIDDPLGTLNYFLYAFCYIKDLSPCLTREERDLLERERVENAASAIKLGWYESAMYRRNNIHAAFESVRVIADVWTPNRTQYYEKYIEEIGILLRLYNSYLKQGERTKTPSTAVARVYDMLKDLKKHVVRECSR